MQATHYALDGVKSLGTGQTLPEGSDYQYYDDARIKFASDFYSDTFSSAIHDRAYAYDHAGRIALGLSGAEARDLRDGTNHNVADGPFKQVYSHDAWDNLAARSGRFWSQDDVVTASYDAHNRNAAWSYDADGNLLSMNEPSPNGFSPFQSPAHTYDAVGSHVGVAETISQLIPDQGLHTVTTTRSQTYDGNGQEVKRVQTQTNSSPSSTITYYLRSSALGGQVIAQLDGQGVIKGSYVFARGTMLAQVGQGETGVSLVSWEHPNPVTGDVIDTGPTGNWSAATHLDSQGVDVGESDPFPSGNENLIFPEDGAGKIAPIGNAGGRSRCILDGLETECSFISNEAAAQCQNNDCGPRTVTVTARARDGSIVGSYSFLRSMGQVGWDGSLDGTYFLFSGYAAKFNFSSASGAASFVNAIYSDTALYGDSASELFQKTGGGAGIPQNPYDPKNQIPLTSDQLSSLRRDTNQLITARKDCMEFISNLLFTAAKNSQRPLYSSEFLSDPMKIFEAISGQDGFRVAPGLKHGGQAMGGLGRRNAMVLYPAFSSTGNYGESGLAEILHHAGAETYTDQELGWAGYETLWAQGYHVEPPPKTNDITANSNYFHNTIQFRACSPNQKKR
jgi:YD repeat-containing protein